MFNNITPAGLRKFLFLFASLIFVAAILSCCSTTNKNHFVYNPEEGQFVWSEYQVENDTQLYAYKYQDHFMVAKNCVNCGIIKICEAEEITQTTYANEKGEVIPCLAFKRKDNAIWEAVTYDGSYVVNQSMELWTLPHKVTDTGGDSLQIAIFEKVQSTIALKK